MAPQSPLLRTAAHYAVRYGPIALAVAQQARGPAQDAARRAWETHRAQRLADDHARTLRRGTVLAVVHEGQRHWVVFAGDEPVITYPPTDVPMMALMVHADLGLRRPPAAPSSPLLRRIARMGARDGQAAPAAGTHDGGAADAASAPGVAAGPDSGPPAAPGLLDPQRP